MSRSHMLYDNQPLESIPVKSINWPTRWNIMEVFRFLKGNGLLIEGKIHGRSRFAISDQSTDSAKEKFRYIVLHVEVFRGHKRQFDKTGKEIEPNFSQMMKVNTGFLMSSYKTCPKGETDLVSATQVAEMIKIEDLHKLTQPHLEKYKESSIVAVWCEESQLDKIELNSEDHIRFKTKGGGPFVEMISKLDQSSGTVSNYAGGESVGSSWTDKVMAMKTQDTSAHDSEQPEGVEESEWDD